MTFTITYLERAVNEYESAIEWYGLRSERAALNFEFAIKERIDLLRSNPNSFRKTYKQFHEVSLNKYPYSIIYLVDEEKYRVIISSFFHHKRNPKSKYRQ